MTPGEVALLLGDAATVDSRKPSEAATAMWYRVLGAYDFADAREALVVHYRQSTDRVMPAHLVALMDEWDRAWIDGGRFGPRPAGWPEIGVTTVAGPDLPPAAKRAAMGLGRPAIEGPR